jgi:hypothetical protein
MGMAPLPVCVVCGHTIQAGDQYASVVHLGAGGDCGGFIHMDQCNVDADCNLCGQWIHGHGDTQVWT